MKGRISKVTVIGYEEEFDGIVHEWQLHNDDKTVIGMDEKGRTVVLVPRHLCIIMYDYGEE